MLRSVELGRAVLCLPTTNLELWLTTLITISLTQDSIDAQNLKAAQFLNLLSSGEVWTHRGPGMFVEIHVTQREEPVPHAQLQDLIGVIIRAPLWEQLMLQLSQPSNIDLEPGIIHLNINYANISESQQEQQHHRICSNVPAADVRPPEGIPTMAFHSVRFSLQFLDPRPRQKIARKRSKVAAKKEEMLQAHFESPDLYDSEEFDDLLHEVGRPVADDPLELPISVPTPQKKEKKRKRSKIRTISPSSMALVNQERNRGTTPESSSDVQPRTFSTTALSDQNSIENLVDGAVRLSIYGSFTGKSACGIKVKANTFHLGLADVAPALWRPGYLPALSQRAHLLNTVSRSINQAARVKATSMSLKQKAHQLEIRSAIHSGMILPDQASVVDSNIGRSTSSIACQLWRHAQKTLTSQPAKSLRVPTTYEDHQEIQSEPDEILSGVVQPEASL